MNINAMTSHVSGHQEMLSKFQESQKPKASTEFSKMLGNSISEVNTLMQNADKASQALSTGESQNIHESMIALEKADTALKLMVQVRNKALEAYNDILRMQV